MLLEEPSVEMEQGFADYGRVSHVQVILFQGLEFLDEEVVHLVRQVTSIFLIAESIVFIESIQAVPQVYYEVLQVFVAKFAHFFFEIIKKLSKDIIYRGNKDLIFMDFFLFFMFSPVRFDCIEIYPFFCTDLSDSSVSFLLFVSKGEKLDQILLQELQIIVLINFVLNHRLYFFFDDLDLVFQGNYLYYTLLIVFFRMFVLDMSIESWITQVRFLAFTCKIPAIFYILRSPLFLDLIGHLIHTNIIRLFQLKVQLTHYQSFDYNMIIIV